MKLSLIITILCLSLGLQAQETTDIYEQAIGLVKKSSVFKQTGATAIATGSKTISFTNQAYAFWLDGLDTRFNDKDFENFFGDLYQPKEIESFKKAGDKRRSKYQLYVSETDTDLFVIEMLSRKRKRKAKYPKFYQGQSISFLFEKTSNGGVRLIETLTLQNN